MQKDPAFLFYPQDFVTGTMFFSFEQKGKYITLLCAQHQQGGLLNKNIFNTIVGDDNFLRDKFIETEVGFYNERLMKEIDKRSIKSNNLSEAAKETWSKRKAKEIQLQYNCNTKVKNNDTIVIRTENEDEDVIEDKDLIVLNADFEKFWNLYDRKRGKEKTLDQWKKLTKNEIDLIFISLPEYVKNNPQEFRKDPERYLKHKCWKDEIIKRTNNGNNGKGFGVKQYEYQKSDGIPFKTYE